MMPVGDFQQNTNNTDVIKMSRANMVDISYTLFGTQIL